MAEPAKPIFNQRATDKLRSPDDLDKYVRVTNPSVWVILCACIALLTGLLSWGFFGSVTTSIAATGVCLDGRVVCFIPPEDIEKVHEADVASVSGRSMSISEISPTPSSRGEAREILDSDYLVSSLVEGDWAYQVTFSGNVSGIPAEVPLHVQITTERIAPIELILGGDA